ncbi:MAG: 3-isopropylmalate dehydratase [Novosphingobium sp.]|nr:3-isopropylmalate dehydratase [Novosphingobium sp.]
MSDEQRPLTLVDKIWERHVIHDYGDGWALLAIDRNIIHDLSGPPALAALAARGLPVLNPELVFATPDHAVSSQPGRTANTFPLGGKLYRSLRDLASAAGIRMFDIGEEGQGIVHVMGPELGLVLPGATLTCGDSHTCTNGALGALAFGVGTSESMHILGTSALRIRKPEMMRITVDGALGRGVTAKDLILHILNTLGASAAVGHIIEFAGEAVRTLEIEQRLTLCNLAVELGARSGIVAPDDKTFDYLRGRRFAPTGAAFDKAVAHWRTLSTDHGAPFAKDIAIDATTVAPTITWGTSPDQSIRIDGLIPDLDAGGSAKAALDYMGLTAGDPLIGTRIDVVFIGSCANSRLSDLRAAAAVVQGKRVAAHVKAWVVPGSETVKRLAEAEGLHTLFRDAGFEWREPGCSMCVAANGEIAPPGSRVISTSNRNFVGRQGPGARTHLASPATAAAAAIAGKIVDTRKL